MKKLFLSFLLSIVCLTGMFAKTAVVYFSCTGNSRELAQTTSIAMEGDLFEIEPLVPYTSKDLNWKSSSSRASLEKNDEFARPAIKNKINLESYDTIIIVHPIWWGFPPKIIYTFVESTDLAGKKVVNICTSGSVGIGNTGDILAKLAPESDWRTGKRFVPSAKEEEIKEFLEEILQ